MVNKSIDIKNIMFFVIFLFATTISASLVFANDFSILEHNASVELIPEWSVPGDSVEYMMTITNEGPDRINEVRIFKNPDYENFDCEPKEGWFLDHDFGVNSPGGLGTTERCTYELQANYSGAFGPGNSSDFYFNATTPAYAEAICDLRWYVQTIDNNPDAVGEWELNYGTTIIDEVPPTIATTVIGPNRTYDGDLYIMPDDTIIQVDVADDEAQCNSGLDYCEWGYDLNGVFQGWNEVDGNGDNHLQFNVTFPENSNHTLLVQCFDRAGNEADISEDYIVDGEAPVTTLDVNGPFYVEDEINYLNGISNISLTAEDNKFDDCGTIIFYELEKDGVVVQKLTGNYNDTCAGEVIVGPFDEEGTYTLKYKSKDYLDNKEDYRYFTFVVDKTAPVMSKKISEPKIPFCDLSAVSDFALDQDDMAQNNGDNLMFNIDVLRELDCEYATWTFDFVDYSDGWDNQVQLIIADGDDVPLFHVASPNKAGDDWYMKEFDGGWGSELALPGDIVVTGAHNSQEYTIKIPVSYLDYDGFMWAVNTEASFPRQSSSAQQYFPVDWTRWSASAPHNHFEDEFFKDWYVNSSTDVSLSCVDAGSGLADIYYRYGNRESAEDSFDWYSAEGDGWVSSSDGVVFNFPESSEHKLEWYCVDNVDKTSETDVEYFRVDNDKPIINKTVIGEHQLGDCPPDPNSDEVCFISDETVVSFTASDVESIHASDDVMCTYEIEWNNDVIDSGSWMEGDDAIVIRFTEDSEHNLTITCEDGIGNEVVDVEKFKVDMTPPETVKTYGDPVVFNGTHRWISSDTLINLSATDNKAGVKEIHWRYVYVGDDMCEAYPEEIFRIANGLPEFNVTQGNFTQFSIPQTSCHMIEYFAVDEFDHEENIQRQFVMVDNSAPNASKIIGEPKILFEDAPTTEYFSNMSFDYYHFVSQDTSISLTCDIGDQPHPVGEELLKFKVFNDGDDVTSNYCGDETLEDGYCIVDSSEYEFKFMEDSEHVLEFYCVDELGNANEENVQFYFVDTIAPTTTHTIEGPMFVDENNWTYIDTATTIDLSAIDPEPHPSGVDETYYAWMKVDDAWCRDESPVLDRQDFTVQQEEANWTVYEGPFGIDEESCHKIIYYSVDELGNTEQVEEFYTFVDKSAPTINKSYVGDYYEDFVNDSLVKWITTSTDVVVDVTDDTPHPSGLDYAEYRVSLVDDALCWDQNNTEVAEGSGSWTMLNESAQGSFNVGEESCHLIEIRAVDNVNKTATHKQLVFVDDTAPVTAKAIGNPNSVMSEGNIELGYEYFNEANGFEPALSEEFCLEGDQNCMEVTLLTSIDLACNDLEPHPSEGESVYFKVHWDGDDVTEEYCDDADGNMTEDGYCYLEEGANSFHFLKESWHRLEYYCEDNVGNVGEPDVEYFKVEGTAFRIELNKKWNLISVPVKLLDNSMDEVFQDQEGVVSVWTYDGTDWSVWSPSGPSDLTTMYPGWGYWVLNNESSNLTIGGSLLSPTVTPPSRPIVNGWNLIGYYGADEAPLDAEGVPYYEGPDLNDDGMPAYCALSSLVSNMLDAPFPSLWTYWEDYNPDQWMGVNAGAGDFMNPGAGYWLLYSKSEEGVYGPSTSCGLLGGI